MGLIVTGGIAPMGRLEPRASQLSWPWQVGKHRIITDAVHASGSRSRCRSAGRYAYHPLSVAPSSREIADPRPVRPRCLRWDQRTIARRVRCAARAKAGYDGVEIMDRVLSNSSSRRGTFAMMIGTKTVLNRIGFHRDRSPPREAVGPSSSSSIGCRCSISSKVVAPGTGVASAGGQAAGAMIINTKASAGTAFTQTIATMVPRAAFGVGDSAAEGGWSS